MKSFAKTKMILKAQSDGNSRGQTQGSLFHHLSFSLLPTTFPSKSLNAISIDLEYEVLLHDDTLAVCFG
jgi:hypothetical protein